MNCFHDPPGQPLRSGTTTPNQTPEPLSPSRTFTTTIVVVQTILGLLGFWVAGTEVKSIIRGSTTKHALGALWSIFIHGKVQRHNNIGADLNEGEPPREDA
jgi:hypothetical protein